MAMLESRTYLVVGRVQGVGFRWFTYDVARREGLVGVVRNEPDGAVSVVVEGDRAALERFEVAIRRGPSGARVDRVDVEIGPAAWRYRDFSIGG
jgi:acylphosphatase